MGSKDLPALPKGQRWVIRQGSSMDSYWHPIELRIVLEQVEFHEGYLTRRQRAAKEDLCLSVYRGRWYDPRYYCQWYTWKWIDERILEDPTPEAARVAANALLRSRQLRQARAEAREGLIGVYPPKRLADFDMEVTEA